MKRKKKGFTLVELLIVVAIIGIVAAIAIPNLLVALQKGKQKATMGDLKTVGEGIESYSIDMSFVPQVGTITELQTATWFVPFHIKAFVPNDSWGTTFDYTYQGWDIYSVTSYGRNKVAGGNVAVTANVFYDCTRLVDFDNDIVFSNAVFVFGPRVKK